MCSTCGCSTTGASFEGGFVDFEHAAHDHHHQHGEGRIVSLEQDILAENNRHAAQNRAALARSGTLTLNLMSSPGSGKTTLLVETLQALPGIPACVIEGDQQTSNDAERIRATGRPAVQINTGKGCHLDGHMVAHALERLKLEPFGFLFIENVGNLVCPAAFDLGENHRVVMLSTTEGSDKPLKYPDMFAVADVVLITKADLTPYVDFNEADVRAAIARLNPGAEVLTVSVKSENGLKPWLDWLLQARRQLAAQHAEAARTALAGAEAAMNAVK